MVGPMPLPVQAPPATGFDDVTNGYVPWSRSSMVPWAPSNSTACPARSASSSSFAVSAMYGSRRCAKRSRSATSSAPSRGSRP